MNRLIFSARTAPPTATALHHYHNTYRKDRHTMTKPSDETAVRDKVAALPAFRDLAARLHDVITAAALRVLDLFELDRPIRLLGVRLELAPLQSAAAHG